MREAIERWNSHVIAALLRDLGVEVHYLGIVPDDKEAIYRAVSDAVRRFDMVITTGGVSSASPTTWDLVELAEGRVVRVIHAGH